MSVYTKPPNQAVSVEQQTNLNGECRPCPKDRCHRNFAQKFAVKCYGLFCATNCGEDLNLSSPDLLYSIRQGMQSASRRTKIFGLSPAGTGVLQISVCLEVGGQVAFVVEVQVSIMEHLPEPASGISLHHHFLVVDIRTVVFALVSQHGVDDVNQLVGRGDDGFQKSNGITISDKKRVSVSDQALRQYILDSGWNSCTCGHFATISGHRQLQAR